MAKDRVVEPGQPDAKDARAALAAINCAADWAERGLVDAIVTAPVSKQAIHSSGEIGFRGHTDHLARRAGLDRYRYDYLMAFLTERLNVVLHSVHVPLRQAISEVRSEEIVAGLACLARHRPGANVAVAGLNPHAGEGGLLGSEDAAVVEVAVRQAADLGISVSGPHSPDSVFARAEKGEFDWVYALYHDQGLIAVKTLAFGSAVNWTMGLPYVRTSVDHGTAFDLAGQGVADCQPMRLALHAAADLVRQST